MSKWQRWSYGINCKHPWNMWNSTTNLRHLQSTSTIILQQIKDIIIDLRSRGMKTASRTFSVSWAPKLSQTLINCFKRRSRLIVPFIKFLFGFLRRFALHNLQPTHGILSYCFGNYSSCMIQQSLFKELLSNTAENWCRILLNENNLDMHKNCHLPGFERNFQSSLVYAKAWFKNGKIEFSVNVKKYICIIDGCNTYQIFKHRCDLVQIVREQQGESVLADISWSESANKAVHGLQWQGNTWWHIHHSLLRPVFSEKMRGWQHCWEQRECMKWAINKMVQRPVGKRVRLWGHLSADSELRSKLQYR